MVLVGVALGNVAAFFLAVDLATTRFEDPTIGAAVDSLSKEDSVSDVDSVSKRRFWTGIPFTSFLLVYQFSFSLPVFF
jgi:hypothetical protein